MMHGFVFNGISSLDFPWLIMNHSTGSLLPPIERKYIVVPGRPGAYHAGREIKIRVERIRITILADSQEELAERRRILAEWLDVEGAAPFYYTYEPEKIYKAVLSGETDLDKVVTDAEVELIFEMPDPYAQGTPQSQNLSGEYLKRFFDSQADFNGGSHYGTQSVEDAQMGDILRLQASTLAGDWVSPIVDLSPVGTVGESSITFDVQYGPINLLTSPLAEMNTDSDGDDVADYWTKSTDAKCTAVWSVDSAEQAQRITVLSVNTGPAFPGVQTTVFIPISPNRSYTFSAEVKGEGNLVAGATGPRLEIVWYTSSFTQISNSVSPVSTATTFTRHSVTATSPSNAAYCQLKGVFRCADTNATGSAWWRNAILYDTATDVQIHIRSFDAIDVHDMAWDSNSDGTADGFTKNTHANATATWTFDSTEKAQRIQVTASTGQATPNVSRTYPVIGGNQYTASVLVKAASVVGDFRPRLHLEWLDASQTPIGSTGVNYYQGASYSRLYETATAPANAAFCRVRCEAYCNAAGATGIAWFKELMFFEGDDTSTPYPAWQAVASGNEIPGIRGTIGKALQVKASLTTNNTSQTPKVQSITLSVTEDKDRTITYNGTAPGFPKFIINVVDPIPEIRLLHVESGKFVLLRKPLGSFNVGDIVEVDHAAETVKLNGAYSNILSIKSRFFPLLKGINTIEISPVVGAMVVVEWSERWK